MSSAYPIENDVNVILIWDGGAGRSMVRGAPRNLGPCYARAPYVTIIKLWGHTVASKSW